MNTPSILIVEDDTNFRRVLEFQLKEAGYQTTVAENGEKGLELFSEERHRIVLTDLNMPGIGGRGFYEIIVRELPELADRVNDPRKNGITIEQLLQMRAGYPWEESYPKGVELLYSGFRPSSRCSSASWFRGSSTAASAYCWWSAVRRLPGSYWYP